MSYGTGNTNDVPVFVIRDGDMHRRVGTQYFSQSVTHVLSYQKDKLNVTGTVSLSTELNIGHVKK